MAGAMSYQPDGSGRRSLLSSALLLCLVLGVSLACKKKKEPSPATVARAAELKPKATERLAQIAGLAAKIKSDLPAAPATLTPRPYPATVAVIGEKYLEDPHRSSSGDELDLSDAGVSVCKYVVANPKVQDDDIKNLEDCSRLEYAAVIHQSSFTAPEAQDNSTYKPGQFSGSVLVFHLASGELRSRFSIDVTQDQSLKLSGKAPEKHEWEKQAMAYLRRNVQEAVQKKL
jgi:hypothetical protein